MCLINCFLQWFRGFDAYLWMKYYDIHHTCLRSSESVRQIQIHQNQARLNVQVVRCGSSRRSSKFRWLSATKLWGAPGHVKRNTKVQLQLACRISFEEKSKGVENDFCQPHFNPELFFWTDWPMLMLKKRTRMSQSQHWWLNMDLRKSTSQLLLLSGTRSTALTNNIVHLLTTVHRI